MYKPLPDNITIKRSPIHGLGLYATDTIPEDTDLGLVLFSDQSARLHRTPMGGFGNHSDNPNCKNVSGYWHQLPVKYLMTTRPIKSGEELTAKYTLYKDFDDDGN